MYPSTRLGPFSLTLTRDQRGLDRAGFDLSVVAPILPRSPPLETIKASRSLTSMGSRSLVSRALDAHLVKVNTSAPMRSSRLTVSSSPQSR